MHDVYISWGVVGKPSSWIISKNSNITFEFQELKIDQPDIWALSILWVKCFTNRFEIWVKQEREYSFYLIDWIIKTILLILIFGKLELVEKTNLNRKWNDKFMMR